ncbi:MAG: hypothetical protein IJV36_05655, partial [Prevotella sp.]|nr:hypothetical protein [Prevotella sp.]
TIRSGVGYLELLILIRGQCEGLDNGISEKVEHPRLSFLIKRHFMNRRLRVAIGMKSVCSMLVPEKWESVTILMGIDTEDRELIERMSIGLISKVDNHFWEQGYSVRDAFVRSSENGYKKEFYIRIEPKDIRKDSRIDIIDEEKAEKFDFPSLESLTKELIKEVRNRSEILYAYVRRSEIAGLEFLENHIMKEDSDVYILKTSNLPI